MPTIDLKFPPGMSRNGTDLDNQGRWHDGNLVRWREGVMRPIGGWIQRSGDTMTNPPRGAIAWEDTSGDRWLSAGTYDGLFVFNQSGVMTDITPAGFTDGLESASVQTGYGYSLYGLEAYGVERADTGIYSEATTWQLDTWGQYLVACSSADGKLYEWQLDVAEDAEVISGAPVDNLGLIVTEERFLFALGASANPRLIKWCDQSDNTDWTPSATNQAGDHEFNGTGQIMAGARVRGQTLILTELEAHTATYIGQPFIYSFERVGSSCGLVSRKAVASIEGGAIWMGQRSFFQYNGGAVEELQCEVADYIFDNINRSQASIVFAVSNAAFGECWWFYPSEGANECDSYVIYNYEERHWSVGMMNRCCGIDRGTFRNPIWFSVTGEIYNQEYALSYDGAMPWAETAPITLGDQMGTATRLIPDERNQGDVQITFKTRPYPNGDETSHGPYTMAEPTPVRFTGRQIRMRLDAIVLDQWRFGGQRLNVEARGRR